MFTATEERHRWRAIDGELSDLGAWSPTVVEQLEGGEVGAAIWRGLYPADHCHQAVRQLHALGLVPSGDEAGPPRRHNVGSVLGWSQDVPGNYFEAAATVRGVFGHLFASLHDPLQVIYGALSTLAGGAPVATASEADGRGYAPAVIRMYPKGVGHLPHYDELTTTPSFDYRGAKVREQLAFVLCLQNSPSPPSVRQPQPVLYEIDGRPDWKEHYPAEALYDRCEALGVRKLEVELSPGDFYVFRSRTVHEVPPVRGNVPRIVVAGFCGFHEEARAHVAWA